MADDNGNNVVANTNIHLPIDQGGFDKIEALLLTNSEEEIAQQVGSGAVEPVRQAAEVYQNRLWEAYQAGYRHAMSDETVSPDQMEFTENVLDHFADRNPFIASDEE